MQIQVYRANSSSYQDSKFLTREQRILEEIPGVKYIRSLTETVPDVPFIIITNTHTQPHKIAKNILEKTSLIIHPNSGHDNFQAEFVQNCEVPIILGNPIRANAVCEYTLGCLFQHFTQVPHHQHWSSDRNWNRKLLRDQKILILGHGHIGKILLKSLGPLCLDIKAYDPALGHNELNDKTTANWDENIFNDVSVLILAASENPTSHHIINHQTLKRMSPDNIIINPARGGLINEAELVQYLQKNPKSKCYLDVFAKEPFSPGQFHELPQINKTSHIAGVYEKLNHDIISFEYLIIKDYLNSLEQGGISSFYHEYRECILNDIIIEKGI